MLVFVVVDLLQQIQKIVRNGFFDHIVVNATKLSPDRTLAYADDPVLLPVAFLLVAHRIQIPALPLCTLNAQPCARKTLRDPLLGTVIGQTWGTEKSSGGWNFFG